MKNLKDLTKEELIQVIALKTEMLTKEDEENADDANFIEVCDFIGLMGKSPDGYTIPEFRKAIETAYEYYINDYGNNVEEMADSIGITVEKLLEIAD